MGAVQLVEPIEEFSVATSVSELTRYVNKPTKRIDGIQDLIDVELEEYGEGNDITRWFWVIMLDLLFD